MAIYRTKTFSDLYTDVMRRIKIPTSDADALAACKAFLNTRYESIAFRKKWRWRKAHWDMKIHGKYTTGTVSIVNGNREITGTATSWTADHKNWWIKFGGCDEVYKVITMNTATQVADLSSEFTGTTTAASGYTLFQFEYGLVPDCEEIDIVWHDHYRTPCNLIAPREFVELMAGNPGVEGYTTAVTVNGYKAYQGPKLGQFILGHDYLGGDNRNDLQMSIFPFIPDQDFTLHMQYQIKIQPMNSDSDEPLMPVEKRHILIYGALSDMYSRERLEESSAIWENKWEKETRAMEQDHEYTDGRPKFVVGGRWWRRRRDLSPQSADLGSYFDRIYSPYKD